MSQKQIKKNRKEIRRVVDKNMGIGLEALSSMVRPRPKYLPKFIWIIFYLPLFEKKYINIIYKSIK